MNCVSSNKSLSKLTTFKVEAKAAHFIQIDSVDQLMDVAQVIAGYPNRFVLGGGSNVLLVGDVDGLVIYPQLFGIEILEDSTDWVRLSVAASENWHQFVCYCLQQGYHGIENLALIPGTVGAAPVQNIGAYGVEIEQFIESVECFDLVENKLLKLTHEQCEFGYRDSLIKRAGQGRYLVTRVVLKLSKLFSPELSYSPLAQFFEKHPVTPEALFKRVCDVRQTKLPDPEKLANAGSFFKNPVISEQQYLSLKAKFPQLVAFPVSQAGAQSYKVAAGWLIENAGFKGKQFQGVGVHTEQALVLVNYSESDGGKIWQLAETIMQAITQRFDITLEPEVRVLGQ